MRTYPDWVHDELINWSRWCWLGPWPHPLPEVTCGSVEKHYTRFREENTTDEARPTPPNERHARIVAEVFEDLPHGPRLALLAEYPQRWKYAECKNLKAKATRAGFGSERSYVLCLTLAVERVRKAFEGKQ